MTTCTYSTIGNPAQSMDARQFGYWSAQWSGDNALNALKLLQQPPFSDIPILRLACSTHVFPTTLMLIALHGAAYWMFAAGLPCGYGRIDTETFTATLSELKQGREDSIRAICPPTGGLLPPALAEFTNGLFGKFFNDLLEDMPARAVANPHALNFKLSKAAATFMEVLEANYKTAFQVHEQLIFGSFVDTTTLSVATAISKTMQVDA